MSLDGAPAHAMTTDPLTKSLELRAATSLGQLWKQQGKQEQAHDLLAPIYNGLTEGFDTADLQDAKALLLQVVRTHRGTAHEW